MVSEGQLTSDIMAQSRYNSRPWHVLIIDFAGTTTMHGIRYLAEPTRFLTRRFVTMAYLGPERGISKIQMPYGARCIGFKAIVNHGMNYLKNYK